MRYDPGTVVNKTDSTGHLPVLIKQSRVGDEGYAAPTLLVVLTRSCSG